MAVLILISYLLSRSNGENLIDNLTQSIDNIIKLIPLHKLDSYVEKYEHQRNKTTFVDTSTKTYFESNVMKKILLEFAKNVQKIANLSILKPNLIEVSFDPLNFSHFSLTSLLPMTGTRN